MSEIKFVTPTHFELTLVHKNKETLEPIIPWLLVNGAHSFQWEMRMLADGDEYTLSIQSSGANNLEDIARLLGDYEGPIDNPSSPSIDKTFTFPISDVENREGANHLLSDPTISAIYIKSENTICQKSKSGLEWLTVE